MIHSDQTVPVEQKIHSPKREKNIRVKDGERKRTNKEIVFFILVAIMITVLIILGEVR